MSETNPIALVDELNAVLERYIATTLPISRRYPRLAERFRAELEAQKLVEGPYVEALPDFEKGKTLLELTQAQGGFLHDDLGRLPTATRHLHLHQQRALEYAVRDGKSLLVATGTGSGKTETFLYPIAHALLNDLKSGPYACSGPILVGLGSDREMRWPPEVSLMAFGITLENATALGHRYGQNALPG